MAWSNDGVKMFLVEREAKIQGELERQEGRSGLGADDIQPVPREKQQKKKQTVKW